MAFPKKGIRKITIDKVKYGYKVTGNDGWISFSIGLLNVNGQILTGTFSYFTNQVPNFEKTGIISSWSCFQRIKITPDTIRKVIEHGLRNGWDPHNNKGQLDLGNIDDKIALNLKKEIRFPELELNQVALHFASYATGHVLKPNKELYLGEGEIYMVFDSIEEAKDYAREAIRNDPGIECIVRDAPENLVFIIDPKEVRFG